MTIFDSIKYPLSDPPTVEEFNAIPHNIYYVWFRDRKTTHDYKLLRKIIAEYNQDEITETVIDDRFRLEDLKKIPSKILTIWWSSNWTTSEVASIDHTTQTIAPEFVHTAFNFESLPGHPSDRKDIVNFLNKLYKENNEPI